MRQYTKPVYHGPRGPRVKARDLEWLAGIFADKGSKAETPEKETPPRGRRGFSLCGECSHFRCDEKRTIFDREGHKGGVSERMGTCLICKQRKGRCDWGCEAYEAAREYSHRNSAEPVRCIETGEVFKSAYDAEKQTGFKGILTSIDGGWRCGGLHWEMAAKKD